MLQIRYRGYPLKWRNPSQAAVENEFQVHTDVKQYVKGYVRRKIFRECPKSHNWKMIFSQEQRDLPGIPIWSRSFAETELRLTLRRLFGDDDLQIWDAYFRASTTVNTRGLQGWWTFRFLRVFFRCKKKKHVFAQLRFWMDTKQRNQKKLLFVPWIYQNPKQRDAKKGCSLRLDFAKSFSRKGLFPNRNGLHILLH